MASQKDYPVDLSHFNVMGTAVGAIGIEEDSDKAIFPNVDLETRLGHDKGIKLRLPIIIGGLGSTNVAAINWDGLAIGSALAGTILTIGENVCGMDVESTIKNGKVIASPELERRVKLFKDWQRDGYGEIVLQANVEDTRLGAQEYAIEKLGVETVELKWGQGAKDIGGEVKIKDLDKAQLLKKRGYVVLPDPLDPARIGAYRPADLARAVKFSSLAKIDYLTADGAGGGTGMSPWRMMNEWGVPTVELWSLLREYCDRLAAKGEYVPDVSLAGGFTMEDQMFKGFAICAPHCKAITMARSPLAAAMVGKTIGKTIENNHLPIFLERFGHTRESIFVTAEELKREYGKDYDRIPTGAIGLYTYYERLAQGLRQLMCGSRKFALEHITSDDIAALTPDASALSRIPMVTDLDAEEVDKILG
jgi:hypothetical protein